MAFIVKMRSYGYEDILELSEKIVKEIDSELACHVKACDNKAVFICCEEYYFRVSNYVSLSIMLTQETYAQEVILVGSGAGDGLLNMTWGADKSIVKRVRNLFSKYGFEEVKDDGDEN